MISLKSYLSRDGRESENAYLHIIDLMLQGLVAHAVQGESSDYERFRAGVDRFTKTLTANVKPADLVATAGELVRTWEEYDRSTTAFIQRENCELHNMVSMLTQTIIKVGANDDTSAAKLREIEKGLEQAKIFKDVQLLKTRLSECLETVREELARQKADSQNAMAALEQELERSCQRADMLAQQKQRDPVTGLLSRNEAEKAIQATVGSPEGKFVMVAVVSRVLSINERFGYAVGDHVLSTCARHYRAGLSASDELYRWRGPAFLGILSRHARIDQVRGEIRQFASAKLEDAVDLGDRVVLIPVSSNWSVMPFTAPPESLLKKVAAFTAAQVSRDYV
ncbi:MAG TPA: GGDEF domain-containing protein [Bryobacteraceae bacterium]|nr:GGDEF domain-containing protein [Bryobacteraceae bacterium]